MKRITIIITMAVAAILFVACSKNEEQAYTPDYSLEEEGLILLKSYQALPGKPFSISAGFATSSNTRSRLEVNAAQTAAKVLWTAGDSFYTYALNGEYVSRTTFKTQNDGVSSATFTTNGSLSGDEFFSIYPVGNNKFTIYGGNLAFGVNIPYEQTAVASGIAEGLNLAFAYSTSIEDELRFHNIPSLLRFRLSGSIVPQVKRVKFVADNYIAGDFIIQNNSGYPEVVAGLNFVSDNPSNSITLSGDFVEGKDYFIAMIPTELDGFYMLFTDENDNFLGKVSPKTLPMERSNIIDFGTISLGNEFTDEDELLYMKSTQGTKPVTIAVIPDGFTAGELPEYESLAKSGIDALFATEPFKSYKDYFNVYILKVASAGSGANITDGNGNIITARDCYFGSKWGKSSYSDMSANSSLVFNYVAANCPDIIKGIHTIAEVPILIIINDTRYGGICRSWSNGMGYCMAPYSYSGGTMGWSYPNVVSVSDVDDSQGYRSVTSEEAAELGVNYGDWRNTLVHEFGGHCFSKLADEYWYTNNKASEAVVASHSWPVPFGLNISGSYSEPTWQEFLDKRDNLVSIDAN